MSEPIWLTAQLVVAIHNEQLREFGGSVGVRDPDLLEAALSRSKSKWACEGSDLPELAAAYACGLVRNHPFVDGNKRVALLAVVTFLGLKGIDFIASEAEAAVIFRDLAAGEVQEAGLARWIGDNWPEGAARSLPRDRT